MNILPRITTRSHNDNLVKIRQKLIRQEAKMGGKLFGPVPKGTQREFFCLDEKSFVWHETWNENGRQYSISTRYEVRPEGVFKTQNGGSYQGLTITEAVNLYNAVGIYRDKVAAAYSN
ncbi:MAG TPA: hypothetical protein VFN51_01480 [Candidatus Saccharimonadales bacterium]|nr:hypothetical protein [Candidatus Saccharimonadales bacterium]